MSRVNNVLVKLIDINKIINPLMPMRTDEEDYSLIQLLDSIKKIGLLNPITVNKVGETYEIIAGYRRVSAFKALKEKRIPAFVWESGQDDILYARMSENTDRKEVSIIEEALYLDSVRKAMKLKNKALAVFVKRSEAYISERLAIVDYNPNLLSALKEGQISFSVAREFNRVKDKHQLYYFLKYATKGGCSPAQTREWVQDYLKSTNNKDVELVPEDESPDAEEKTAPVFKYPCHVCTAHYLPTELTAYQICPQCKLELEL